jgi:hypothetical protein
MEMPSQVFFATFVVLSMLASGCLGGNEAIVPDGDEMNAFSEYQQVDTEIEAHADLRQFLSVDLAYVENWPSLSNDTFIQQLIDSGHAANFSWAVYDATYGGNCCEHYIAATKEGSILNFGGEYPVWSHDRGHVWDTYLPTIIPDTSCRTPAPTAPGQEGLGEGSIVQAVNGDLISMGWFPYAGLDLKVDKFYAFLYDENAGSWSWCYNRITEPFYDRSWQVEIVGPIESNIGSNDWGSLVISNFWHQTQNVGGQVSIDGLNYYPMSFPGRNDDIDIVELELNASALGVEWDFTKPHKEMRAFPVPESNGGGLLFPNYFSNGDDAYLGTTLTWVADPGLIEGGLWIGEWYRHQINGAGLPSDYCNIASQGGLHCFTKEDRIITHMLSWDGGYTWQNQSYNFTGLAESIEEWEFHISGENDLVILNVRYQSAAGPDIDTVFHIRGYSESLAPDSMTFVGLGDLDSTSGAGNDIRFDFASITILNDGGAVIAYHDSSDPDPLFAVEQEMPDYGPEES